MQGFYLPDRVIYIIITGGIYMKILKDWKKTGIIMMAGVLLSAGFTMPSMAHGHGGHHRSGHYSGTYCSYHHKTHKNARSCKYYCTKHDTTHRNGKCH